MPPPKTMPANSGAPPPSEVPAPSAAIRVESSYVSVVDEEMSTTRHSSWRHGVTSETWAGTWGA